MNTLGGLAALEKFGYPGLKNRKQEKGLQTVSKDETFSAMRTAMRVVVTCLMQETYKRKQQKRQAH